MTMTAERTVHLQFRLNGIAQELTVPAHRLLIHVLREDLEQTGTKEGCSVGVCGACSVLVDGVLLSSCLVPAVRVDGCEVTTIEGVGGEDGSLSPLQHAFIRHGGFQCGICTPGQIVAATALLAEHPQPDEETVREWMTGNLCRCTGYFGIVNSILAASGQETSDGAEGPLSATEPTGVPR